MSEKSKFSIFRMFFASLLISMSWQCFFARQAHAEYRLYRLKITDIETQQSRLVTTTLDNVQYRGYFPIRKNEVVTIDAHWMCWDRHGESWPSPYCPQPAPAH